MGLLEGKTAIVTGSSRGIGRGIAQKLSEEGANVVINFARSQKSAEKTAASLKERGGKYILAQADVSDLEQVKRMVEKAVKEFGAVDIVVNNAVNPVIYRPFEEQLWDDYQYQVEGTLKACFNLVKATMEGMKARKWGRIINISTMGVYMVKEPGLGAYITAKSAMLSFAKYLAETLGPYNITINTISPGLVNTPGTKNTLPPEVWENGIKNTPLRRNGEPEDIAKAVVFFSSNLSDWITGTYLPVCGGSYML